jgi:hypothetical protein
MAEESSRLLSNSESFRTCSIAKNGAGYTPNSQYCAGVPDTVSDGDNRGRDPEADGAPVGTVCYIEMRDKLMAKNSDYYTKGDEYCAGHEDTISDGDNRGRDPETNGSSIGTETDIKMRNCLIAKNSDRYTKGDEYCAGHEDTLSDGDNKGRDPEQQGGSIGTNIDIQNRTCLGAKNLYKCGKEYCVGNA